MHVKAEKIKLPASAGLLAVIKDLNEELGFLAILDMAMKATKEIVDMPNQKA